MAKCKMIIKRVQIAKTRLTQEYIRPTETWENYGIEPCFTPIFTPINFQCNNLISGIEKTVNYSLTSLSPP